MAASAAWNIVPGSPTTVGNTYVKGVPVQKQGSAFFRLFKPRGQPGQ